MAGLVLSPVPLVRGVPSLAVALGLGLGVVVLLLILRRIHVRVALWMLLASHVVGVGRPLLVVGGVVDCAVVGVGHGLGHRLVRIRLALGGRHGSTHGLVIVWVRRAAHTVLAHASILRSMGLGGHGWIVTGRWPSRYWSLSGQTSPQLGLGLGAEGLLSVDAIGGSVLQNAGVAVLLRTRGATSSRVRPAGWLTGPLVALVSWAGLGGQLGRWVAGGQGGEGGWLGGGRLGPLWGCTLGHTMHGAELGGSTLERGMVGAVLENILGGLLEDHLWLWMVLVVGNILTERWREGLMLCVVG